MGGKTRRGERPLKRKVATRRPRKTVVVLCEGTRTEPEYITALKKQPAIRDVAAVDIRIETGAGGAVPRTLVSKAVAARDRAMTEEAEIDEFWCVFDVEWPKNHPGLSEALRQAHAHDIKLAVSNPCFELWLILHFRQHHGWLDNEGARKLRRQLDGSTDKGLDAAKYMSLTGDAVRRAADLDKHHARNEKLFPYNNPSSSMHLFLASIGPASDLMP